MKMQHLRCSWALQNDSKHNKDSFSTTSTDLLYLRVAQMSRCSDLAIFVLTDGQTDRQTDGHNRLLYPLRMHVGY
jgi:hypothetical protein